MWYFNTHTHTHTHPCMTLLFQTRGGMREQEKSIRRCRSQLSSAQPAGHPWAGQCTSLGIFVLPYVSGRLPWAPQTSPGPRQTHAEDHVWKKKKIHSAARCPPSRRYGPTEPRPPAGEKVAGGHPEPGRGRGPVPGVCPSASDE